VRRILTYSAVGVALEQVNLGRQLGGALPSSQRFFLRFFLGGVPYLCEGSRCRTFPLK
jgi:hypothetical protein